MNTQRVEGHTPTPWAKNEYGDLIGADGSPVTVNGLGIGLGGADPTWKANGAFVFYAVNNIERLEKVNEALVRALERLEHFTFIERWAMKGLDDDAQTVLSQVQAALSLAKEHA